MPIETVPEWMAGLEEEDVAFIRRFVLASGSLKEVAGVYGVTYPTVRLRLDRLIQKIRLSEDTASDPYWSDQAAGSKREAGLRHGQGADLRL